MSKTTAEKIAVMQAFEDGEKIEFRWVIPTETNWLGEDNPTWDWYHFDYCIAKERRIPDTIDWSHVAEEFICCARTKDERPILSKLPLINNGSRWSIEDIPYPGMGGPVYFAEAFSSFYRGTLPWDQSLIYRPGYEPKEGGE